MNKKRLDINRFEYHDNVSVDFTQDTQKKETIIYYDYYLTDFVTFNVDENGETSFYEE